MTSYKEMWDGTELLDINSINPIDIDLTGIKNEKISKINIFVNGIKFGPLYHVKCIEELRELNIKSIHISNCRLDDISFLEGQDKIDKVNFSNCLITDLTPLKNIEIRELWLFNNKITDISCFKDFKYIKNLTDLSIMNNPIKDYRSINYAENLKQIYIGKYIKHEYDKIESMSDELINVLGKLKHLESVNSDFDIDNLRYRYKLNLWLCSLKKLNKGSSCRMMYGYSVCHTSRL